MKKISSHLRKTSCYRKKNNDTPAWTIKKEITPVSRLLPGYTVEGKEAGKEKAIANTSVVKAATKMTASEGQNTKESASENENTSTAEGTSTEQKDLSETDASKTAPSEASVNQQKTKSSSILETAVSTWKTFIQRWQRTDLFTKVLLLFALLGIGFICFWARARKRFRKYKLQYDHRRTI